MLWTAMCRHSDVWKRKGRRYVCMWANHLLDIFFAFHLFSFLFRPSTPSIAPIKRHQMLLAHKQHTHNIITLLSKTLSRFSPSNNRKSWMWRVCMHVAAKELPPSVREKGAIIQRRRRKIPCREQLFHTYMLAKKFLLLRTLQYPLLLIP